MHPDFKPMLAATVKDIETLPYPMIATPKIDGIRCITTAYEPVSRKLKPIPNRHIREALSGLQAGFDGELTVGGNFQACTSGIMSHEGAPDFIYWVFDLIDSEKRYEDRLELLRLHMSSYDVRRRNCVELVPWETVNNPEELSAYEADSLELGFEGVCLRTPDSPYKFGRSTLREGYLLKLKRFVDAEAVVIGFEEQYRNTNDLGQDELGYAKRRKTLDGREAKGTLGKFLVKDVETGIEFAIGTGEGLNEALRLEIWQNRDRYLGRIVTYKSQPFGRKDAPRLPIWKGFRDD